MNNNTNAVSNAVAAINESRQKNMVGAAQAIILNIESQQKAITAHRKSIEAYQAKIAALRKPIYTQSELLGVEMMGSLNQNEVTIAKTIETMNSEKQKLVEAQTKIDLENITHLLGYIAACEKNIEAYRKQLSELTLDEVSPSIAG